MKLAKIQIEDIKTELSKDGWNLVSTEYHNLDEILEYTCNEGHHVFAPWKKIRTRRDCPLCKENPLVSSTLKTIPKKKDTFRVLGLDQATKVSGFSIYDDKKLIKYGIFNASTDLEEIARDHLIKEWLISIIKTFNIDFVGIEGIQYQEKMGVTTFETLARLQGILMETCFDLGVPFKIAPTNTWRAHCGVKGRSRSDKKRSMRQLVKEWFDISVTEDEADAVGIGKYISETCYKKVEVVNWE